ncbi:Hpr(Ser) kinase/phosphatase [Pseudorhodobacter antarcticus]|jgi:HPr kinase/phosphorylase|uniref:Hpr(Ser) kinase/phosphatase n=2 Tax=Pseudorhodobacter antarcticus TaxID=1077947 RepID=A0A1H8IXU2_9RHOB|nr:HPr kinase/phosphatase C-terminal domain-containing protein [Pseudorhodobacter antarcticus]SEN73271.1 Hpr(Ser) kinase/phosphatase [Pseudorhodobacter antarcticus]
MQTVHATCVAVGGFGILITGASGQGKSGLGLHLMALGAQLIADDQTILTPQGNTIIATCPPPLFGLIEARGIGLLHASPAPHAQIHLVIDLDQTETQRLPPKRSTQLLGVAIDLVFWSTYRHFPYGIMQLARGGRRA